MSQLNEILHFKILLVGESSVGKSSLMARFVDETFQQSFLPTVGVDFKVRTLIIDNYQCKIQIWDTAGQERFRVITTTYYRDASGIVIVYDVTNAETFSCVHHWVDDVNKYCEDDIAKVLVGNKDDLHSKEKLVSTADAQQYARQANLLLFQASAKDNKNVREIFYAITRLALQQHLKKQTENGKIFSEPIQLNSSKEKDRQTCCK